jgi:hypothetical protein
MSRGAQVIPSEIGPDTPLRLDVAAQVAFPGGGMTASGLRKERDRQRLVIEKIAGKEFTTLRFIEQMRERCRGTPKEPVSGSNQKSEMRKESLSGAPLGSSATERTRSALAALEQTAEALSKPSLNISPRNTPSREIADVIHLKS